MEIKVRTYRRPGTTTLIKIIKYNDKTEKIVIYERIHTMRRSQYGGRGKPIYD